MESETPTALEAEAIAAINGAPIDAELTAPATGAPGPTEDEILAGYQLVTTQLVEAGAASILPAWQVTSAESSKMGGAMARALLLWFPDQIIPPKYMALLAIAGVGFEIAQARRDPETGRYRPARLPPPPEKQPAAAH
jgi:hypothetical protein